MSVERWRRDWKYIEDAPMAEANTVTTGSRVDKVLYGTKGEELIRIQDRPMLGFHRENGRPS